MALGDYDLGAPSRQSSPTLSILSGNAHRDQRNRAIHFRGNTDGDRHRSSLRVAQPCSPQQGQSVPIKRCWSQYALCFSLDGPLQFTQPIKLMMATRNRFVGAVSRLRRTYGRLQANTVADKSDLSHWANSSGATGFWK